MSHPFSSRRRSSFIAIVVGLIAGFACVPLQERRAAACGGCPSEQATLAEEIADSAVAVICRLVARPDAAQVEAGAAPNCTFEVVECLKGADVLAAQLAAGAGARGDMGAAKPQRIEIFYAGEEPLESTFYARADLAAELVWYKPTSITSRERDYLRMSQTLPEKASDRLALSYDYLEAPEPLLATDAYETFARASYADVAATKARMPREKLLKWIADVDVQSAHRKQYLYMLAVCGTADDVPKIEALLRSGDAPTIRILDAVIGCYLVMRGAEGLPLVEQLFLSNREAEGVDTEAAIRALRFTAVESLAVSRERIDASLRLVLERPELADLVVPDLIRSRDWTITPQLTKLFREAEQNGVIFIRVPIAGYFLVCPTREAATVGKELQTLDPEAFRRAERMYGAREPSTGASEQPAQ